MRIADRVSVLQDGRSVGTFEIDELTEQSLVRLIVGNDLPSAAARAAARALKGTAMLQLRDVSVGPLRNVSLDVAGGEIVGVAGDVGSGRSSLLRAIFGAHSFALGQMLLAGSPVRFARSGDAIEAGVAYVLENWADDAPFLAPIHRCRSLGGARRMS